VRPLKPAPDPWLELPTRGARPIRPVRVPAPGPPGRWLTPLRDRDPIALLFATIWGLITLPFRLVFGIFGLIGRFVGIAVGFVLMVLGAALSASPFPMIGVAVFVVGLLVSMRSLG
jgi:hypothetical protein